MQKVYVTTLFLLLSLSSIAQIKKNSILLGGQLSYFNNRTEWSNSNQKREEGNIDLLVGKAVKENKIIGVIISFSPFRQANSYLGDTNRIKLNRFAAGIFYRIYRKLAKDLYFFGQLDGSYITSLSTQHFNNSTGEVRSTEHGGLFSFTPGIAYQLFKRVQIEMIIPNIIELHYLATKTNSQVMQVANNSEKEFGFNTNISNSNGLAFLGVGFKFIL